jgi:hypothetical protein
MEVDMSPQADHLMDVDAPGEYLTIVREYDARPNYNTDEQGKDKNPESITSGEKRKLRPRSKLDLINPIPSQYDVLLNTSEPTDYRPKTVLSIELDGHLDGTKTKKNTRGRKTDKGKEKKKEKGKEKEKGKVKKRKMTDFSITESQMDELDGISSRDEEVNVVVTRGLEFFCELEREYAKHTK